MVPPRSQHRGQAAHFVCRVAPIDESAVIEALVPATKFDQAP